jgi:cytosine/adenosine deaminase-related metal-dependent hydrolase
MKYVAGEVFTQDGFKKGYLGFERDKIVEHSEGSPPEKPLAEGFVVPTFINAHTHLGDSFVREKDIELPRNVVELVAPPNGLKHRLLKKASEEEIVEGMKNSIELMMRSGISGFCDFRENGVEGVYRLKKALKSYGIRSLILSRPKLLAYDKEEVELLLKISDGIGISSISDWMYPDVEKIARDTRRRRKIFALHASEVTRENIDLILDLKPHFLVHMLAATESDLLRVKEENIPVVICPRAYVFFNLKLDLQLMKKTGVDLMLGTDNAMLNTCNVLDEMRFLRDTSSGVFSTQELLNMVTYTPRKALNLDDCIQGLNLSDGFVVLDKKYLKPLYIFQK